MTLCPYCKSLWIRASAKCKCNIKDLVVVSFVWGQGRVSTYIWLILGYPVLAVAHGLACFLSWLLVFTIPVAKVNARTLGTILLTTPEDIHIHSHKKVRTPGR